MQTRLCPLSYHRFLLKVFCVVHYDDFDYVDYFVVCLHSVSDVLIWLSVPLQLINYKDSYPKYVDGDDKPY